VKFDLPPPLVYTGAEARDAQALQAWFASHPGGPIDYQIRDLMIAAGGDVAFCHSLNQLAGALWFPVNARAAQDQRPVAGHARAQLDPVLHGRLGQGSARPAALMPR
jgi:hypothetical protein